MRITYKLVVDDDGNITEEEFDTNEAMIEKAKTYDPTYTPPEPVKKPSFLRRLFGEKSEE
jgi:hypothetical protein